MRLLVYFLIFAVLVCTNPPSAFPRSLLLDASIRQVVEDNVNPLLPGAAAPRSGTDEKSLLAEARLSGADLMRNGSAGTGTGDLHTVLSAGGGVSSVVGPEAEVSIKAGIERRQFSKFPELNATTAGLYGTAFKQFSDINAAQIGLSAFHSTYAFRSLGGRGIRASFDLRQILSMKCRLSEGFEYERYDARSGAAGYDSRGASLRVVYRITPSVIPVAAYARSLRRFGNGMQTTMHSAALSAAWRVINGFDITASFERQAYTSAPLETRGRDNISSLGISVYY